MTAQPILMREADARDYLGGADPAKLVTPLRIGRGKFYSRLALDRAVAEKAGLPPPDQPAPRDAYEDWKKSVA